MAAEQVTREALIAAATVLHDEECRSCDRKYRMSCPDMANAILRSGPAATAAAAAAPGAAAPEPGYATFARWWHGRQRGVSDGAVREAWRRAAAPDKAAWASVEDWHPAIREQVAVLNAASEAMEKLTAERDMARREARKLSAALDVAIARLDPAGHAAVREALEHAGLEES